MKRSITQQDYDIRLFHKSGMVERFSNFPVEWKRTKIIIELI